MAYYIHLSFCCSRCGYESNWAAWHIALEGGNGGVLLDADTEGCLDFWREYAGSDDVKEKIEEMLESCPKCGVVNAMEFRIDRYEGKNDAFLAVEDVAGEPVIKKFLLLHDRKARDITKGGDKPITVSKELGRGVHEVTVGDEKKRWWIVATVPPESGSAKAFRHGQEAMSLVESGAAAITHLKEQGKLEEDWHTRKSSTRRRPFRTLEVTAYVEMSKTEVKLRAFVSNVLEGRWAKEYGDRWHKSEEFWRGRQDSKWQKVRETFDKADNRLQEEADSAFISACVEGVDISDYLTLDNVAMLLKAAKKEFKGSIRAGDWGFFTNALVEFTTFRNIIAHCRKLTGEGHDRFRRCCDVLHNVMRQGEAGDENR